MTYGESLVRYPRFEDLARAFWRKFVAKRLFWRLGGSKSVPRECPTRVPCKSVSYKCPTKVLKSVRQKRPRPPRESRVSPQERPTRVSRERVQYSLLGPLTARHS